jgi:hypothetical protein
LRYEQAVEWVAVPDRQFLERRDVLEADREGVRLKMAGGLQHGAGVEEHGHLPNRNASASSSLMGRNAESGTVP